MLLMTLEAIWVFNFIICLRFILESDGKIGFAFLFFSNLICCMSSIGNRLQNNPDYKKNILITRFCFKVLINLITIDPGSALQWQSLFLFLAIGISEYWLIYLQFERIQDMDMWIFLNLFFIFPFYLVLFPMLISLEYWFHWVCTF